jgi:predicted Zn-dependent protease
VPISTFDLEQDWLNVLCDFAKDHYHELQGLSADHILHQQVERLTSILVENEFKLLQELFEFMDITKKMIGKDKLYGRMMEVIKLRKCVPETATTLKIIDHLVLSCLHNCKQSDDFACLNEDGTSFALNLGNKNTAISLFTDQEKCLINYLTRAHGLTLIKFDHFPFDLMPELFDTISENRQLKELRFHADDMQNYHLSLFMKRICENQSIVNIQFILSNPLCEQHIPHFEYLLSNKPELLNLTIISNNQEFDEIQQLFFKRNYLLHSCGDLEFITKSNHKQRNHLIKFCEFHIQLEKCLKQLMSKKEAEYNQTIDQLQVIKNQIKQLQKDLKFDEIQLKIIHQQLLNFSDALLPDCESLLPEYHKLFCDYTQLSIKLQERHLALFSIGCNPYSDQESLRNVATKHNELFAHQFNAIIKNIKLQLPSFHNKITANKKTSIMPGLLLTAATALSYYINSIMICIDELYQEMIPYFNKYVLNFYKKEIIKDSYFNYAIFTGLMRFSFINIYYVTSDIQKDAETVDNAYHIMNLVVEASSNQIFQFHGFSTINKIFPRYQLIRFKVDHIGKKIKETEKLGKRLMTSININKLDYMAEDDAYINDFKLCIRGFFIDELFFQSCDFNLRTIESHGRTLGYTRLQFTEQENYLSIQKDYVKNTDNLAKVIDFATNFLKEIDKIKINDLFILEISQLLLYDYTRARRIDPAVSFAFTAAHNGHMLVIYQSVYSTLLEYIDGGLDYLQVIQLLKNQDVNSPQFMLLCTLLELKEKLLKQYLDFQKVRLTIQKKAREGIILLPSETYTIMTPELIENDEKKLYDYNNQLYLTTRYKEKTQVLIQEQEARYQSALEEFSVNSQLTQIIKTRKSVPQKIKKIIQKPAEASIISPQNQSETKITLDPQLQYDLQVKEYLSCGQYDAALKTAMDALTEFETFSSFDRAVCLARVANLHQERIKQANPNDIHNIKDQLKIVINYYDQALAICSQASDEDQAKDIDSLAYFIQQEYEQLGIISTDHANQQIKQAQIAYQQFRYDDALAIYEQLQKVATNPKVVISMANCHARSGHIDSAIQLLEPYAQDGFPEIQLELASLLSEKREFQRAEIYFNQIKNHHLYKWHRYYLKYLYQSGQYSLLQHEVEMFANDKRYQNSPDKLFTLFLFSSRLKNYIQAEKYFNQIATENPTYQNSYAIFLAEKKQYPTALMILNDIFQKHKNYIPARLNYAEIEARLGHAAESLESIKQTVTQYPSYYQGYLTNVKILKILGMQNELNQAVDSLINRFPNNWSSNYNYLRYHTNPDPEVIQSIWLRFSTLQKNSKLAPTIAHTSAAIVIKQTLLIDPSELSNILNNIVLPKKIRKLLKTFERIGAAYLYGICARKLILKELLNEITICIFTDNSDEVLGLAKRVSPGFAPSHVLNNVYHGHLDQWRVDIQVKPKNCSRKEFITSLGITINSFLIDQAGKFYDELNVAHSVFCQGIFSIIPEAIKNNPEIVLQVIQYRHVFGVSYGENVYKLLLFYVKSLLSLTPMQIMTAFRKAICSNSFAAICQDWLKFGVLATLIPNLNDQLMAKYGEKLSTIIIDIAKHCDHYTNKNPSELLIVFFSHLFWTMLQTQDNIVLQDIQGIVNDVQIFEGMYEREKDGITKQLEDWAIYQERNPDSSAINPFRFFSYEDNNNNSGQGIKIIFNPAPK